MWSRTRSLFCAPSTLSQLLVDLSRDVTTLCSSQHADTAPSTQQVADVWRRIDDASAHAYDLKETDTLFSIVQQLFSHRVYPADAHLWPTLGERLLTFADVELSAVLSYPGKTDAELRTQSFFTGRRKFYTGRNLAVELQQQPFYVPASRETLLMTGGVVPLSSRTPLANGKAFALFLERAADFVTEGRHATPRVEVGVQWFRSFTDVLLRVLAANEATTQLSNIGDALSNFVHAFSIDMDDSAAFEDAYFNFVSQLCSTVTHEALGSRLALFVLRAALRDSEAAQEADGWSDEVLLGRDRRHLRLARVCALHTVQHLTTTNKPTDSHVAPSLQYVLERADAIFQNNANQGNLLQLDENYESQVRTELTVALLRALRLEAESPDTFLRSATELADRCASSVPIECELIAGKAGLLDAFELEEDVRQVVYTDLVTSLRNLVNYRPKRVSNAESSTYNDADDAEDVGMTLLDEETQKSLQEAHCIVIKALCGSHKEQCVQDAYNIVVVHKYHGLIVTKEIILPLTDLLSRRGDCRVFNLVDLCVLYSNSTVDMDVITHLFRSCAVSGDVYRAQTLLQLLKETIPGFLLKASAEVKDCLRALHILEAQPLHLFVSEEEKLVRSTMGLELTPPARLKS